MPVAKWATPNSQPRAAARSGAAREASAISKASASTLRYHCP
jgi:hypothetical protein